jgi:hypothetical protein
VVDWIAERERADRKPAAMPAISGVDGLIEGLCAMAELQTGRFAARHPRPLWLRGDELEHAPTAGVELEVTYRDGTAGTRSLHL